MRYGDPQAWVTPVLKSDGTERNGTAEYAEYSKIRNILKDGIYRIF